MLVALLLVCAVAIWLDVRQRRLPNWLTVGALTTALLLRALTDGESVALGLACAALAFAFGFPFFMLGGLGAGDVKLMTALAAFLDLQSLPVALGVMAFTGAAMALLSAARSGKLASTLVNVHLLALSLGRASLAGWKGDQAESPVAVKGLGAVTNPYGVAIVAGALAGWFL
jgi:prepilin peptidase CpaA